MGYYSAHTLLVNGQPDADHEERISSQYNDEYPLFAEEAKWYDMDENMIEYSKLYPDMLFKIERQGEVHYDMSETYFKNGKMQHCPAIITFDKFDESKLA